MGKSLALTGALALMFCVTVVLPASGQEGDYPPAYPEVWYYGGDVNADGMTDIFDIIDVVTCFGAQVGDPGYLLRADVDSSGAVDIIDVITAIDEFGKAAVPYRYIQYQFTPVANYQDLPYTYPVPTPLLVTYCPLDENGIPLYELADGRLIYHPVRLALRSLQVIDGYIQTHNPEYLAQGERNMRKLYEIAMWVNGVPWYPYVYNFAPHGIAADMLYDPWISGMAQGQALSAFTRLYNVTGNPEYLQMAQNTFAGFEHLKQRGMSPWETSVDSAGYVWLEEYPLPVESRALNGFIFAIFGLYDYYMATQDPDCKRLLQATITTTRHYIEQFRNPGTISYYCLKHKVKSTSYHPVHTDELWTLYYLTQDTYFQVMATNFYNDYH